MNQFCRSQIYIDDIDTRWLEPANVAEFVESQLFLYGTVM